MTCKLCDKEFAGMRKNKFEWLIPVGLTLIGMAALFAFFVYIRFN